MCKSVCKSYSVSLSPKTIHSHWRRKTGHKYIKMVSNFLKQLDTVNISKYYSTEVKTMDLLISGESLWQQDGARGIDPLTAVTLFVLTKDHRCKGVTHMRAVY